MKLYLIRHAQSANNAIFSGNEHEGGRTPDPEITNIGHEQSKRLAQFLTTVGNEPRQHPYALNESANFNLTHIYCSLMTRSILTASYIAQSCALTLEARDDVFERKGLYEIGSNGEEVGVSEAIETGLAGTGAIGTFTLEVNEGWGEGAWSEGSWGE